MNMKLLVFVLNQVDRLGAVLKKLEYANYSGATVLDSRGMGVILSKYFGGSLLGSLYAMMDPDQDESRTVFMVLQEEEVPKVIALIEEEAGGFDEPNTGIAFTVPVDFVKGIL